MITRSLVVALVLVSATAGASSGAVKPWLSVHGGASTYSMSDVNDEISALNAEIGPGGPKLDEVNGGLMFGASAGVDLDNGFTFGLGFDRLMAKTELSDASGSLTYELPANLLRGFGEYSVAGRASSGALVGLAITDVMEAGSVSFSVTGVGAVSGDIEGSGLGFEAYGGGQYWASPQLAIVGTAGYRHAKAEIEIDGTPIYNASGERYTVDHSGLFLRLGVRLALTP